MSYETFIRTIEPATGMTLEEIQRTLFCEMPKPIYYGSCPEDILPNDECEQAFDEAIRNLRRLH